MKRDLNFFAPLTEVKVPVGSVVSISAELQYYVRNLELVASFVPFGHQKLLFEVSVVQHF
jgi:hypothetical protein